jgi:SAM-dependent methyltransferase
LGRDVVAACLERFAAEAAHFSLPLHLLAVDCTCGNGHDTCFLAQTLARQAGPWRWSVLSFDVQQAALDAARALLARHNLQAFFSPVARTEELPPGGPMREPGRSGEIRFFLQGHEHLEEVLASHFADDADREGHPTSAKTVLAAVMYNLGFLPRSDRRVITRERTTISSLSQAAEALSPGGVLAVHAYGGHAGGGEELEAVTAWFSALSYGVWHATRYSLCNKPRNPEILFLAGKDTPGTRRKI